MTESCDVAIVGSGFAGSLLARVLVRIGYHVVLLERGTHPRFAIGESSTPLANLSLERLGTRYGLADCYAMSTHGRWLARHPDVRRGLKRGFTFYRHHPGEPFANRGLESERLLVAASPHDEISDTHWYRADVDHHFVREAIAAGVDYRDRADLTSAELGDESVRIEGARNGSAFALRAKFIVDASGPGGFLARQFAISSGLEKTETRSALVFSLFDGVRLMKDVVPGLPAGPYPDDWAAVHHVIDEGWMYSLRFDHGTTSAGFLLSPRGAEVCDTSNAQALWWALLARYPTLAALFDGARALMPVGFRPVIQHRLTRAAGERWVLMPHAYAFVDPLFSTGIAWSLRAVERLGLMFESTKDRRAVPSLNDLARYDAQLAVEADQIDKLVAGAYEAMTHFDLLAAHAMLYFATVSFAEVSQRLKPRDDVAWDGFLGTGDPILSSLPHGSLLALRSMTASDGERRRFGNWIARSIEPRNIAGLSDRRRGNLYPVDLDALVERHQLLGMSRSDVLAALPSLRGPNGGGVHTTIGAGEA